MPQFDLFSSFVQISWLFLFSSLLYVMYLRFFIVKISRVMKMRKKVLSFKTRTIKSSFLYDTLFNFFL